MARPKMQCQVCGKEEDPEVVQENSYHFADTLWIIHRIEQKGGWVQVLACPDCSTATQALILETYKDQIRKGLILGFH